MNRRFRNAGAAALLGWATSGLSATCAIPPSGLIGWWPGDGSAADVVSGNNGTLEGGLGFAPGKVGDAFSLDGIDDLVSVADAPNLNPSNEITIEAWVFAAGFTHTGEGMGIISKNAGGEGNQYALQAIFTPWPQVMDAWIRVPSGNSRLIGTNAWEIGRWYHVAETYDGSNLRLYVNGSLDTLQPVGGQLVRTTQAVRIGKGYADGNLFNGLIDEASIYSRAISEAEVRKIYEAGSAGKCKGPAFATFNPRVEFKFGDKENDDTYWARGWLKLADTSNGINPMTEPVTINVGNFFHTIPAGSFTQDGSAYKYVGVIGPAKIDVSFWPKSTPGVYWFKSCIKNGDLNGMVMPPKAALTIGDDSGQATLDVGYAKFGKGADGKNWVFPPMK